jgi:hypothetical protein
MLGHPPRNGKPPVLAVTVTVELIPIDVAVLAPPTSAVALSS